MPNWCNNKATITVPNHQTALGILDASTATSKTRVPGTLLDAIEARDSQLFNTFHPIPLEVDGNILLNWYDWCCANWGTKWEPNIACVTLLDPCTVEICFDTAWSPPIEWFTYVGKTYGWEWSLVYIECGMGFAGRAGGDKDGCFDRVHLFDEGLNSGN